MTAENSDPLRFRRGDDRFLCEYLTFTESLLGTAYWDDNAALLISLDNWAVMYCRLLVQSIDRRLRHCGRILKSLPLL